MASRKAPAPRDGSASLERVFPGITVTIENGRKIPVAPWRARRTGAALRHLGNIAANVIPLQELQNPARLLQDGVLRSLIGPAIGDSIDEALLFLQASIPELDDEKVLDGLSTVDAVDLALAVFEVNAPFFGKLKSLGGILGTLKTLGTTGAGSESPPDSSNTGSPTAN